MFGMRTPASRFGRLAATALLTVAAVGFHPEPASAVTFGSGWSIYGNADCYQARDTAYLSVSVQEPTAATNGLYFVVEFWAKGQYDANWTQIGQRVQTGLVKTWTRSASGAVYNSPVQLASSSFGRKVAGRFDVGVQYWTWAPGATRWSGPFFFQFKYDAQSTVMTYDEWGYAYRSIKDCYI